MTDEQMNTASKITQNERKSYQNKIQNQWSWTADEKRSVLDIVEAAEERRCNYCHLDIKPDVLSPELMYKNMTKYDQG